MQIDLEPHEFRHTRLLENPTVFRIVMRGAVLAALWFVAVLIFGRYVDHGQPWWVIASAAGAPLALLFYVAVSLD